MKVYLDNATTTKVDRSVLDSMSKYLLEEYGAPTTEYGHSWGVSALEAIQSSRETIARSVGAEPDEVIFTSGGVESTNMAIQGVALRSRKGKILTTGIEHSSILKTVQHLEKLGFTAEYLGVDEKGFLDPDKLDAAIDDETVLVTLGHGNGEIGTVQNVRRIAEICRSSDVALHLDARASYLWEKLDLREVEADLVSLTGHTIHGPKGIGVLVKRKGLKIDPILHGPGTEFNERPGTINVPGAVGMARAVEIWDGGDVGEVRARRDRLWESIKDAAPDTDLTGPVEHRLANNLSCNFKYIEGESILLYLDMAGIAVSTGSACSSKSLKPSYVLSAIGIPPEESHGSIRFSLSRFNNDREIEYACEKVTEVVKRLKSMSSMR